MPLRAVQADLAAFLRYVFNSFQGLAEHRQVRLHFLPDNQQIVMDFDPEKLEELVGNLLSNALKYTPAGGDVYLNFYLIKTTQEQLVIKVKDTGIGISADKLGYIFDRFYKINSARTRERGSGSGLGLYISKGIIENHAGRLYYNSMSLNTEFIIAIPFVRKISTNHNVA